MRIPRIGVTGPTTGGWVARELTARALRRVGAEPVQLVPGDAPDTLGLDGVVLGGGADVDPRRYGRTRDPGRRLDPARDELEFEVVRWSEDAGVPLLGICRGAQLWNVARGGTLVPDVSAVRGPGGRRRRLRATWEVSLEPSSDLAASLGTDELRVNRLHTQAIDVLGTGLVAVARDRFGIVQAVERPGTTFRVGVQWHPELLLGSAVQRRLFRALADAARATAPLALPFRRT